MRTIVILIFLTLLCACATEDDVVITSYSIHYTKLYDAYLVKQVGWQRLPPRQRDREGFDVGPPPVIEVALKNLERSGDWKREFRISIGPALEEYLSLGPPAMSREGKQLIGDFLNRERDKLLGF